MEVHVIYTPCINPSAADCLHVLLGDFTLRIHNLPGKVA
jgi:hypothetical protein